MSFTKARATMVKNFERNYLFGVMLEAQGNISHAARLAELDRRNFYKLLKKHNITKQDVKFINLSNGV